MCLEDSECTQASSYQRSWALVNRGRLWMAQGRLRMACGAPNGSSTDGPWSSTDGPWSSACGWPEVVCGWPKVVYGWPVVVYGRPMVVYGWPVVVCGWPNRCSYVADIRSATALQFLAKVVVMPVVVQRQVPPCGSPWRFPQLKVLDNFVDTSTVVPTTGAHCPDRAEARGGFHSCSSWTCPLLFNDRWPWS